MSTIMIPKKCKAGFTKRSDTFSGKLSYIIYYDEKNNLRKEPSWNSWRDKTIEPVDFDNVPSKGFYINKKVGGNSSGWDYRQTYCRVYDSRGFEFEITISNLVYIMKNTNWSKDNGFEGEFVYGWDKKDLVLIPVDAPEYQEIKDKTAAVYDKGNIKGKDLVPGYTYSDLQDNQFVYLTKDFNYSYQRIFQRSYPYYGEKYNIPNMTETEFEKLPFSAEDPKYRVLIKQSSKKVFWFYDVTKNEVMFFGNLDKKIYNVLGKTSSENLSNYYDMLYRNKEYSKIIYEKDKLVYYTLEEFASKITPPIDRENNWIYFYNNINNTGNTDKQRKHEIWLQKDKFKVADVSGVYGVYDIYKQPFLYTDENIEFVYNIIKPIKSNIHTLENGYTYEDFL